MCRLCFLFPLHSNLYLLSAYIREGKESLISKSSLLLQNAKGIESDIHQGRGGGGVCVRLVGLVLV